MKLKLNIRNKLLLAFAVVIGLTIIVSTTAILGQSNAQATVRQLLEVHVAAADLSRQSVIAMLQARRSEKDYLLRYR
jgi:twitching motility protein PilJ